MWVTGLTRTCGGLAHRARRSSIAEDRAISRINHVFVLTAGHETLKYAFDSLAQLLHVIAQLA